MVNTTVGGLQEEAVEKINEDKPSRGH